MRDVSAVALGAAKQTEKKQRSNWRKVVAILACFVAAGTVSALVLPAITASAPVCGMQQHTHTEVCYTATGESLLQCTAAVHTHAESCYAADGTPVCGTADFLLHTHDAACLDAAGNPVCPLAETALHTHDQQCWQATTVTTDPGHTHTDACWTLTLTEDLICGLVEAHTHSELCWVDGVLVCTLAETHTHTDACRDAGGELLCTLPEYPEHMHSKDCYETVNTLICTETERAPVTEPGPDELICTLPELQQHDHTDACLADGVYTCGQLHAESHQHTDACFTAVKVLSCEIPEHTHDDTCTEQAAVAAVTQAIADLPGTAEIKIQIATYEGAGDTAGLSAYCAEVLTQIENARFAYDALTGQQQAAVTNADILQAHVQLTETLQQYLAEAYDPMFPPLTGDTFSAVTQAGDIVITASITNIGTMPQGTTFHIGTVAAADDETAAKIDAFLEKEQLGLYDMLPLDMHFEDADGNVIAEPGTTEVTLQFSRPVLSAKGNVFALHVLPDAVENITQHVERSEAGVTSVTLRTDSFSPVIVTNTTAYDSVGVTTYNHFDWSNKHTVIVSRKYSSTVTVGAFNYWQVVMVKPQNNYYVVDSVHNYSGDKRGLSIPAGGFALITFEDYAGVIDATRGDVVVVSNDSWNTNSVHAYSATPRCTVTIGGPPGEKNAKDNSALLTKTETVSTRDFIKIDLYDYGRGSTGKNINDHYNQDIQSSDANPRPGFQNTGGQTIVTRLNHVNFGDIVVDDVADNQNITNGATMINKVVDSANKPISSAYDVMRPTLGSDGYPALADGTSLKYLFNTDDGYAVKKNKQSVDYLFEYDPFTGSYSFNSRENHAQFSAVDIPGTERNEADTFIVYDQIFTPNFVMYPFGNFMPFNDIVNDSKRVSDFDRAYMLEVYGNANRLYGETKAGHMQQLAKAMGQYIDLADSTWGTGWTGKSMLEHYFTVDSNLPDKPQTPNDDQDAHLSNMYSLDYDVESDFYFGMNLEMNFIQPKDGRVIYADGEGSQPLYFYFTGDDDVWVYIDGVLTLDLSGIHRHVGGAIDFENGVVLYFGLDTLNGGDVGTTWQQAYKCVNFEDLFEDTALESKLVPIEGKYREHDKAATNGVGSMVYRFDDYGQHNFKFYYMERGSGSSVCRLNFNMPTLQKNSITVNKELENTAGLAGDPDFYFQVMHASDANTKTNTPLVTEGMTYRILSGGVEKPQPGVVGKDGVFTLKAGETAIFDGILENAGYYYVRELLDQNVYEQYGSVAVSGTTTTTYTHVVVEQGTFKGAESSIKDISDGSTQFVFKNTIDPDPQVHGKLAITKKLVTVEEPDAVDLAQLFRFEVKLDGKPLPVGTAYTVAGETGTTSKTVEQAGIITLRASETAVIGNIMAGSRFTVQELLDAAAGYSVSYSGANVTIQNGVATGVVQSGADNMLTVRATNSEKGAVLTIPVAKQLLHSDGQAHVFTLQLQQINGLGDPTPVPDPVTQTTTVTVPAGQADGMAEFEVVYDSANLPGTLPLTLYYLITELPDADKADLTVSYDPAWYVAVVELTADATAQSGVQAAVTALYKDGVQQTPGTDISFTNTLVQQLTLQKKLVGVNAPEAQFMFLITVQNGETPISGKFAARRFAAADTAGVPETVTFDAGQAQVTLKPDESLVISGLPHATVWTVTEQDTDGYLVSTVVDQVQKDGVTVTGQLDKATTVLVINRSGVLLPETGGMGTRPFTMAGAAMAAIAAALLVTTRKKRRRRANE